MEDQKLENILNLSLSATTMERSKSPLLESGYDADTNRWDIIVKYAGDLTPLIQTGIVIALLYNDYAVLNVTQEEIDTLSEYPQVTYIEKPKPIYFSQDTAKRISCITPVNNSNLRGNGCLIAIIDSGIDYFHPAFRNADGTTRIWAIWDQSVEGTPPDGYVRGSIYSKEQIQAALDTGNRQLGYQIVNSRDVSGHGTAVAGIAAGSAVEGSEFQGVASESELLIVKLGSNASAQLPRTSELMMAIDYCIRTSVTLNKPISVNLSYGNTYGSHDGSSLLETYIDSVSGIGKNCICIGTGNEGSAAGHTSGAVPKNSPFYIELAVSPYQTSLSIQLWKSFSDDFTITLHTPLGATIGPLDNLLGTGRAHAGQTQILFYYGEPAPYSTAQEVFFSLLPDNQYIDEGIFTFELTPRKIVTGRFQMWLPSQNTLNTGTRFLTPNPEQTLTIPSTSSKSISVGAYDTGYDSYADFSGRGFFSDRYNGKPDLVAPGVGIFCPVSGGGYTTKSGTSFATPFVSGSCALLMEWGILLGNDPFLYAEKAKAYLRAGARPIRGETNYPNIKTGYGALCLENSFPN